jgi:beta-lactamase superfamily II metal-dependent hydrolase
MLSGLAPSADEIELSVFGPGLGEGMAIHLGDGEWMTVDSCWHDRIQQIPAAQHYLDNIGVDRTAVKHIVATHWHDDHVMGISKLLEFYPHAQFYYPNYFDADEGRKFLAAYAGVAEPAVRGTRELYRSLRTIKERGQQAISIGIRSIIHEANYSWGSLSLTSLSPVSAAWEKAMGVVYGTISPGDIPRSIGKPKTNISSVVMHFDFGSDAMLLGSDLELHQNLGWEAVLADAWASNRRKSSIYKIAHHGSKTACSLTIWNTLLTAAPAAAVTQFLQGRTQLPEAADISRIKGYTSTLHTTSTSTGRPPRATDAERLLTSGLKSVRSIPKIVGQVRYRKRMPSAGWGAEISAPATIL